MSIFKHKKRTGAAVPEMRKPIPMPPNVQSVFVKNPSDKRYKIIDKRYPSDIVCLQSEVTKKFENELNEAIKDGWTLNEIHIIDTSNKSGFVAIMCRYEQTEQEAADNGNN